MINLREVRASSLADKHDEQAKEEAEALKKAKRRAAKRKPSKLLRVVKRLKRSK